MFLFIFTILDHDNQDDVSADEDYDEADQEEIGEDDEEEDEEDEDDDDEDVGNSCHVIVLATVIAFVLYSIAAIFITVYTNFTFCLLCSVLM